jgi:hypothetical protein
MVRFDDYADSPWVEVLFQRVGDLLREPLLGLEVRGVPLDDPGELGEPEYSILGEITDVCHPREREKVVLAERPEGDVASKN